MNAPIFWRLVWKEYRLLRSFWIAMAVLAVLASLYVLATLYQVDLRPGVLFAIALTIPALYALGCGATMFATEHETGTYDFQRALPVSAGRLLAGKLGFALISIPALILVLWLLALGFSRGQLPRADLHLGLWGVWGFGAIEALAWGMLFSLISRHPLKAAMLGAAAASIAAHGLTATTQAYTAYPTWANYTTALPYRLMIVALVGLVNARLASRWFREAAAASEGGLRRADRRAKKAETRGDRRLRWRSRDVMFMRLVWQQLRQSANLLIFLGAMVAPWLVLCTWRWVWRWSLDRDVFGPADRDLTQGIAVILALAAAPLAGTCVFLADQRGHSVRFLAERGVGATSLWWSRQLIFVGAVLLLTFVGTVALVPGLYFLEKPLDAGVVLLFPLGVLGFAALGYACGQLCSMFLRNSLMAGFLSIVLTAILCGWAALMRFFDISWLWSALPIPIVLLLATWLRTRHWMLERNGLRGWVWPGLLLVATVAVLFTAVAAYRAYELPLVDPGFSPKEFAASSSAEARQTADMYRRAFDLYVPAEAPKMADDASDSAAEESDEEREARMRRWVEANEAAIALTLEATRRDTCDAYERGGQWRLPQAGRELGYLLRQSALILEREGELDAALERHTAALRLCTHLRRRSPWPMWSDSVEIEVHDSLATWAAEPGQTAERIRKAFEQIGELTEDVPSRTDSIKCEYLRLQRLLSADWEAWAEESGRREERILWPVVALQALPWEQARGLRALNLVMSRDLSLVRRNEAAIARGEPLVHRPDPWAHEPREPWQRSTLVLQDYWPHVGHETWGLMTVVTGRRGVRLQLALAAWKLEHGEVPESLDALVGPYFDKVPTDPYAVEPFRYFPKGVPTPVTRDVGSPYKEKVEVIVEADQPFVWCAEPSVVVDRGEKRVLAKYRYRLDKHEFYHARTEDEVWRWGRAFPVPEPNRTD